MLDCAEPQGSVASAFLLSGNKIKSREVRAVCSSSTYPPAPAPLAVQRVQPVPTLRFPSGAPSTFCALTRPGLNFTLLLPWL